MAMSKVIRVKPHLTLEDIDARLKNLHDFWRIRRWLVIRHALVDPAPAKDIACRLGLSVFTVRDLIEAYNRHGPNALETPGKGQRQRAYLSVDEERTVLSPFLEESQAGHIAIARMIKKALEDYIGHRVATSTIYRLLHRHHWRKVVPRPKNPRSSQEAQDAFKKTSPP
jgi:transposase